MGSSRDLVDQYVEEQAKYQEELRDNFTNKYQDLKRYPDCEPKNFVPYLLRNNDYARLAECIKLNPKYYTLFLCLEPYYDRVTSNNHSCAVNLVLALDKISALDNIEYMKKKLQLVHALLVELYVLVDKDRLEKLIEILDPTSSQKAFLNSVLMLSHL